MIRGGALAAVILVLTGCAAQSRQRPLPVEDPAHGQVSYRSSSAPPAGQIRYQLTLEQTAIQPTLLSQPAPRYPPQLIAKQLAPVDIAVQLAINGQGRVYHVIVPGEAQADPTRQAFIAAIRAAVAQWIYSPLIIQRMAADADGNSHVVDQSRPAFSQFYVFHFELSHGLALARQSPIQQAHARPGR